MTPPTERRSWLVDGPQLIGKPRKASAAGRWSLRRVGRIVLRAVIVLGMLAAAWMVWRTMRAESRVDAFGDPPVPAQQR
jgi:hypothetical protein